MAGPSTSCALTELEQVPVLNEGLDDENIDELSSDDDSIFDSDYSIFVSDYTQLETQEPT
jgi:hypothetical protein